MFVTNCPFFWVVWSWGVFFGCACVSRCSNRIHTFLFTHHPTFRPPAHMNVLLALSAATMFTAPQPGQPALVQTANGIVQGVANSRFRAFYGLPFAKPPIEDLRWKPPETMVDSWQGARDATFYRHNCMQPAQLLYPQDTLSEDCLYLNVFTPSGANASSVLPVLFWVHGGGYHKGGANESRLNGTWLQAAGYDMIVVTTNYRLNIFGFLGGEALRRAQGKSGGAGNFGILDQRAALQWVRANIANFGGDPSRVLLCGESAGGASVYNHLARPASWGLFHAALAESGGYAFTLGQPTPMDGEKAYQELLTQARCSDVDCLRDLSADAILKAYEALRLWFAPIADGFDLPAQLRTVFSQGKLAPSIPLVAGATHEDLGAGTVQLLTPPLIQLLPHPSVAILHHLPTYLPYLPHDLPHGLTWPRAPAVVWSGAAPALLPATVVSRLLQVRLRGLRVSCRSGLSFSRGGDERVEAHRGL